MEEFNVYKCIQELSVSKCDNDGFEIGGAFTIPMNSEWEKQTFTTMSDVRLESDMGWIEIGKEDLEHHFIRME